MSTDGYFSSDGGAAPVHGGEFAAFATAPLLEMAPGIRFQPLLGADVLVAQVHLDPHSHAPAHHHDEEQIILVLEGEMTMTVDGDERVIRPGDVVLIPPNVVHEARTGEHGCREIDIFNPPRAGLVAMLAASRAPDPTPTTSQGGAP